MKILFNDTIYTVCRAINPFHDEWGECLGYYRSKKKAERFAEFTNFCMRNDPDRKYVVRKLKVC